MIPPTGDRALRSADSCGVGSPCRILVVDDNIDGAESLAMLLRLAGHDVRTAHDGVAALEAAQYQAPEVILLDLSLPRLDGYEVARRLRGSPEMADVYLVAITGFSHQDGQQTGEAGFDAHMVKPVDFEHLQTVLQNRPGPR